ncbi:MAG: HAD hydrolase family protein [Planctomycetes bacterium]|jgi:YrbI family 3-deoxy-D-manno-octulosonate 8-phosphate phosphatase|nr:HAD hydrolase family protein [Planctomycetota bacterium]
MAKRKPAKGVTRAQWAAIKVLACDVDGVLTDAGVWYGPGGELAKRFFIRDGMGLRLLEAAGVRVAVITSEDSPVVAARVQRLMLSAYRPGMKRKGEALRGIMAEFGAAPDETAYIGDDVNDAEAMSVAGIAIAPADASADAISRARYVTAKPGGNGAVREVADRILDARGVDAARLWAEIHGGRAEAHDTGTV